MRPGVTPGPDRGKDTSTAAGSDTDDDVVGEPRWPMAGAVLPRPNPSRSLCSWAWSR